MHVLVKMYVIHCLFCWTSFYNNLYRQVVGIHMGTYCAPSVADLFLFCYDRD